MKNTYCCILLCLLGLSYNKHCFGQQTVPYSADTTRYYWLCKMPLFYADGSTMLANNAPSSTANKKKLLSADGEMSYQHFDRNASSDDLLLISSSSDIAMIRLNLVYKETYPFALSFRYNRASPFQLDDQYELNIGFDKRNFRQLLLEKVTNSIKADFKTKYDQLLKRYEQASGLYEQRKKIAKSPVYAQRVVEKRLRKQASLPGIQTNQPGLPDISTAIPPIINNPGLIKLPDIGDVKQTIKDSLSHKLINLRTDRTGELISKKDSLEELLGKMTDSIAQLKNQLAKKIDSARSEMAQINSAGQLKKYAGKNGLRDSVKNNKWLDLLAKTDIRVGKFLLNNSELTVTNIFLHGASIKYGDEKFVVVSAGFYDFAFRRVFNFRNDTFLRSKPSVFAVKIGKTDGKNLSAVTFYTGKKTRRGSVADRLETVAGLGIEKKIYFNRNLSFEAEIAKSTALRNTADEKKGTIKDLFGTFSSKTIGVYGLLRAYLPKTKTDAELSYRYWGQQFQSFNASQYFNPQNNLFGKISQPFFGRRLYMAASAKYTDFRSFGIASNIHTKAVFASASATLRLKRLPVLSVGYYPGSQLYWLDQSKLYEYFYYIFNTTASHYFTVGKVPVQAVFTYNKFYNKYTDSLVSGSQSYYNLFWTIWKNKFSYTMNFSRQETEWNLLHAVEAGLSYAGRKIKIGGSIKWNLAGLSTGVGYSLNGGFVAGRVGTINLIYDRSFLPDRNGAFIPVRMGQVQIVKPLKFSIWQ